MRTSVREIAFLAVTGQTETINVTDTSFLECRVTINTSAELTGAKAIAFTGSPINGTRLDFNVVGGINSSGASKFTINGDAVPDVNAANPCLIIYRFNGATWERQILASTGGGSFIDGDALLDNSVPADKLENDIAGSGMARDGNGGVIPNLEAVQPSMQIVADELGVKLDPSRAVTKDSNGVGVNLESVDPSLQISANELGVKIAPDKGLEVDATGVGVKVDPAGDIEVGSTGIYLKNGPCACLKELKIEVSSSEILALNSNPKELIPAQGTGTIIDVVSCAVRYVSDGTQYATNTNLVIFASGFGFFLQCDCLGSSFTRVYKFYENPNPGVLNPQLRADWPINLSVENGDPTGGTSTIEIFILYRVMDINA